jgi:phosphatidylglycerophosphate synthase
MKQNNIGFTLVNLLTLSRLIGAFCLISIYQSQGFLVAGLWLLIFFATDLLDGFLARHWECSSFLGAFLDGMSDKVLGIIALCILATLNHLVLVNIIMEIIILIIGYNSAFKGNIAATTKIGKIKTFALSVALILTFIGLDYSNIRNLIYNMFQFNLTSINNNVLNIILVILMLIPAILEVMTIVSYYQRDTALTKVNKKYQKVMQGAKTWPDKFKKRFQMFNQAKKKLKDFNELVFIVTDHNYYLEHQNDNLQDLLLRRN